MKLAAKEQTPSIEPIFEDATPVVYANYVGLHITAYEAILTFCRIDPRFVEDRTDADGNPVKVVGAPVQSQIILPVQVMRELADVLQRQVQIMASAAAAESKTATPKTPKPKVAK